MAGIGPCLLIELKTIVQPRNIHRRHKTVVYSRSKTVQTLRHWTRMVEPVAKLLHLSAQSDGCRVRLFIDLIAYRPHHNGRMVAEEADKRFEVPSPASVEDKVVAVPAFRLAPFVERLRHHHHSLFIANVHLPLARHIVGGTDRIASHLLEQPYLPTERRFVECSPDRPKIMMETNTLELALCTVESKAPIRP